MKTVLVKLIAFVALSIVASAQQRAAVAAAISGPLQCIIQPFDVLHYDVDLDLSKAPAKQTHGVCTMTVHWTGDPASGPFYFHLRGLHVDSTFYNGLRTEAIPVGDTTSATYHYDVNSSAAVRKNDTVIIKVYYSGSMTAESGLYKWGGVTSSGGTLFALGVGFYNNYVSATEHWMPCYDHPSDKATFRGRFTAPKGYAVASNGLLTNVEQGDSTVVYEWTHDYPCATYLYTFAVDKYLPLEFGSGALPMQVWSRAADTAATRETFKLLPQMVKTFAKLFGPYPFGKVGYVNTPLGAMEHQTMVSFPTKLSRSRDTINPIGAHELAHQWFGDLVSPQDFRHAWLNESFAEFCTSLWQEELFGFDGYLKAQSTQISTYLNTTAPQEGILPLYDFPRAAPSSNYPNTIYSKGAVVVGMLRFELGDSIFFASLHDYLNQHAYGDAVTGDLQDAFERHAHRSLQWFFDQWVYGKGWPELALAVSSTTQEPGKNTVNVSIHQVQNSEMGTYQHLPIEFGFKQSNGSVSYRVGIVNRPDTALMFTDVPDFTSMTINEGPTVRTLLTVASVSGVDIIEAAPDSNDVQFSVRPNPANTSVLTVSVKGPTDCSGIDYELYDTSGRRLLIGKNDVCEFTIPIESFNSGAYVLRFKFRNTFYDVPIVIAR